jgi:hypothetical protein
MSPHRTPRKHHAELFFELSHNDHQPPARARAILARELVAGRWSLVGRPLLRLRVCFCFLTQGALASPPQSSVHSPFLFSTVSMRLGHWPKKNVPCPPLLPPAASCTPHTPHPHPHTPHPYPLPATRPSPMAAVLRPPLSPPPSASPQPQPSVLRVQQGLQPSAFSLLQGRPGAGKGPPPPGPRVPCSVLLRVGVLVLVQVGAGGWRGGAERWGRGRVGRRGPGYNV